jgi:hypothetical protein
MNVDVNTVMLLGAAQVLVFITAILSERLLAPVVRSGEISEILENISKNLPRVRSSILVAQGESLLLIALGVLYFVIFYEEYEIIALVALGCFLTAAITIVVGKIGANALIPLSQEFVEAGSPETSYFQTLGDFLYNSVNKRGQDLNFMFSSLAFLLVNYLLLTSNVIPRVLSIWAFVAVFLALIPAILQLYRRDAHPPAMILVIPYAPT